MQSIHQKTYGLLCARKSHPPLIGSIGASSPDLAWHPYHLDGKREDSRAPTPRPQQSATGTRNGGKKGSHNLFGFK